MAKINYSKLSTEELFEANIALSNKRAEAVAAIKEEQFLIAAELDTRALEERASRFSDAEIAALAKLRKVSPQDVEALVEEPVNG